MSQYLRPRPPQLDPIYLWRRGARYNPMDESQKLVYKRVIHIWSVFDTRTVIRHISLLSD